MKFLISSLILLLSVNTYSSENNSALIEESDFQKLGELMKEKSLGLVLMLHAEHCPYCALMENEILSPMVISGDYDNRIVLRKLQIDEARDVKNFAGAIVEPSDVSDKYKATLTPTIVFLDSNGVQQNENMIGINTVELFGAYLDIEIDKFVNNLKDQKTKIVTK